MKCIIMLEYASFSTTIIFKRVDNVDTEVIKSIFFYLTFMVKKN